MFCIIIYTAIYLIQKLYTSENAIHPVWLKLNYYHAEAASMWNWNVYTETLNHVSALWDIKACPRLKKILLYILIACLLESWNLHWVHVVVYFFSNWLIKKQLWASHISTSFICYDYFRCAVAELSSWWLNRLVNSHNYGPYFEISANTIHWLRNIYYHILVPLSGR